jgi:hypothetical protein
VLSHVAPPPTQNLAGCMRILITNNTLADRGGTELYVRDLAIALLRRGHHPIAYSSRLGEVADELRAATIPVIDNLKHLSIKPDLIHGQHHLDCMTALLHFPDVPAVSFCHGWSPWEETPPVFPSIQLYVAISDLCADKLRCMHGIPQERIRTVRNFVDLERFALRDDVATKPRRALAFGNHLPEAGCLEVLREACHAHDMTLDAIGEGSGRVEARPEDILGQYDVVFAMGRCALEALATGAALIPCDATRIGAMVTRATFADARRFNFAIRCLTQPLDVASVSTELRHYNVEETGWVSQEVRREAGLENAVGQILAVYEEAIAASSNDSYFKPETAMRYGSDYLRSIADFVKQRYEVNHRLAVAEGETMALRALLSQCELSRQEAKRRSQEQELRLSDLRSKMDEAHHQVTATQRAVHALEVELAAIHGSRLWPIMRRVQHWRRTVLAFAGRFASPHPPSPSAASDD